MDTPRTDTSSSLLRTALDEADRHEREARFALIGMAVVEAGLLALALYLMDFDDRTHLLMFVLSMLTYLTLALAMLGFAARSSGSNARVLHAIQMLDERLGPT
jgi:hypothetical protein